MRKVDWGGVAALGVVLVIVGVGVYWYIHGRKTFGLVRGYVIERFTTDPKFGGKSGEYLPDKDSDYKTQLDRAGMHTYYLTIVTCIRCDQREVDLRKIDAEAFQYCHIQDWWSDGSSHRTRD